MHSGERRTDGGEIGTSRGSTGLFRFAARYGRSTGPRHQDLRARTARDEEQRRLQAAANERTRAKALQTVTTPTRPATRPATRRNDTGQGWDRD